MNDQIEMRWQGDLQRVALGPEDVLVLTVDRVLAMVDAAQIANVLQRYFPHNKVLVLERNSQLAVVGPEDVEPLREALLKVWSYVQEGRSPDQIIGVIAGALRVNGLEELKDE